MGIQFSHRFRTGVGSGPQLFLVKLLSHPLNGHGCLAVEDLSSVGCGLPGVGDLQTCQPFEVEGLVEDFFALPNCCS